MKLLAIDTATEACSAALSIAGEQKQIYAFAPRRHADLILEMVDSLLQEYQIKLSELDALAYDCGPGSFTGIRISCGVIQGLAFGAALPVIPISSLAALAQGCANEHSNIISAIDARMQEIYWGSFQTNTASLVSPIDAEGICAPDKITASIADPWCGVGSAWQSYRTELSEKFTSRPSAIYPKRYPEAKYVLTLAAAQLAAGNTIEATQTQPSYLRDKVAKIPSYN